MCGVKAAALQQVVLQMGDMVSDLYIGNDHAVLAMQD